MKGLQELGPQQVFTPIIHATPGMPPEVLETLARGANAIIFVVFGNGGSPSNLNTTIKKITDSGIPIFLVADKDNRYGVRYGILEVFDETQVESRDAGAIPLEKVNVENLEEISNIIQKEFKSGKRGKELGKAVQEYFTFKEGEERPIPAWEDPSKVKDKNRSVFD